MKKFKGIYPALIAPFDKNGNIDEKVTEKIVEMNIEKGVTGFYIGGSSAEAFLLSMDERKQIIKSVTECVNKRVPIISHVGAMNTKDAISLAEYSEKCGADLISSVVPTYYKYSFDEIESYYFDIMDATSLKMIMYYLPGLTGVSMSVATLEKLFADQRIAGMKFTATDFFMLQTLKSIYPDKLFFNGFDEDLIAGLSVGADGGIGTTYNFMAEKFVNIYELCSTGDFKGALEIQNDVNKIVSVLLRVGVIPGTKEVFKQMGFDCGVCRKPFKELTNDEKKIVKDEILSLL